MACLVRVKDFHALDIGRRYIEAYVDIISTDGLWPKSEGILTVGWDIAGEWDGDETEEFWAPDYAGFRMYFAERIVTGILDLAAQWPEDMTEEDRYSEAGGWANNH
jgi:hypothetical protein